MRLYADQDIFRCVPEIDFNYGYGYFLGNMPNYEQALLSILKSVKSKLPILHNMYSTEEYLGLRLIAQTLRRMLSNVGALSLSDMSYNIETALINQDGTLLSLLLGDYIEALIDFQYHLEILIKKLNITGPAYSQDNNPSFLRYDFTKTRESLRLSTDLIERKII